MLGFIIGFVLAWLIFRSRKPSSSLEPELRTRFLTQAIADLHQAIAQYKEQAAEHLVGFYTEELHKLAPWAAPATAQTIEDPLAKSAQAYHEPPPPTFNFSNWYADNSISFFLYIGAFLIVASAGTFVGFSWHTLTGITKASILCLVTAAFFGSGFAFYHYFSKLKPAGVTFLTIGALLIPFNGIAWYRFVLQPEGVSYASIWTITSLISLAVYVFLFYYLKKQFFAYIVALSTLSFIESFIRIAQLNTNYYIFGAIITSYVLLVFHQAYKKLPQAQPTLAFQISAQVILPIALMFGLAKLIQEGTVFTIEATASLAFTALFYATSYYYDRKVEYFAAARAIFLVAAVFATQTFELSNLHALYSVVAANYILDALLFVGLRRDTNYEQLKQFTVSFALLVPVGAFLMSYVLDLQAIHQFIIAVGLACQALLYFQYFKKPYLLFITNFFLSLATFIYFFQLLERNVLLYPALVLFGIALANYLAFEYLRFGKHDEPSRQVTDLAGTLVTSFAILATVAFCLTLMEPLWQVAFGVVIGTISVRLGHLYKTPAVVFFTTALGLFCVIRLLVHYDVAVSFYPLIVTAVAAIPYFASYFIGDPSYKPYLTTSGLFYATAITVYSLFRYTMGEMEPTEIVNALGAAYFTALLFFIHAYVSRMRQVWYAALAFGLTTYYWQIYELGSRELQMYLIPTALVIFGLGYFYKTRNEEEHQTAADMIAMLLLIMPTFFQSLNDGGTKYALLLAAEALILIFVGLGQQYKIFTYGGGAALVLAVLSQTYQYVLSLERWIVLLLGGVILLGVAIFLLQKRGDQEQKSKDSGSEK